MSLRKRSRYLILFLFSAACGDDGNNGSADASIDGSAMTCESSAQCDDGLFCNGSERCQDQRCVSDEPPCGSNECDERTRTCDCPTPDADGDGVAAIICGGRDCDDGDPNRFPGNTEVCDEEDKDEDCDPSTYGTRDVDRDGYISAVCCNIDELGNSQCGDDCADGIANIHPTAPEVCDLSDQDCDGTVDEGAQVEAHPDEDGDLHGDEETILACAGFAHTSSSSADCDDGNPHRNGVLFEVCDGIDNDCDEIIDEETTPTTWYVDADDDGFGNPNGETQIACTPPDGYARLPLDCDDDDENVHPAHEELCNALDDDCDGIAGFLIREGDTEDNDGDGYADSACGGDDCDDLDELSYPGAVELRDEVDNDCDGTIDEDIQEIDWFTDNDGDGAGDEASSIRSDERQPDRVTNGGDCNDADSDSGPTNREVCNGVDDDCDEIVDEDTTGSIIYYRDVDGDGFGDDSNSMQACTSSPPEGFTDRPGDCNDNDERVWPTASERCNESDDDCDEIVDEGAVPQPWYRDADGDTYGTDEIIETSCSPPSNTSERSGDCDDLRANIYPGATEECNGVNEDCDAQTDEGLQSTFYPDQDGDGYGDPTMMVMACEAPANHVDSTLATDCDDDNSARFPGNPEICDALDNDCNDAVDEGLTRDTYYLDGPDGDGYARNDAPNRIDCGPRDGYVSQIGDCDDNSASIHPEATEHCNGVDDDCDTTADEDSTVPTACSLHADFSTLACAPPPASQDTCLCTDSDAGNCDDDLFTGCESDLTSNALHCGQCDMPCGDAQGCNASSCEAATILHFASGLANHCILRDFGVWQCWGVGQYLFESGHARLEAERIQTHRMIIDSGHRHTTPPTHCFIVEESATERDIYCVGNNSVYGLLGGGSNTNTNITSPERILAAVDDIISDWEEIVIGSDVVIARRRSGQLYTWGNNAHGNLGRDTGGSASATPAEAILIDDASQVDITTYVACAVRSSLGQVWCWGSDSFGRSGDGVERRDGFTPEPVVRVEVATEVPLENISQVATYQDGGCALQTDGDVWCWGIIPGTGMQFPVANQITEISNATHLSCGTSHCCAVVTAGAVRCWGNNAQGQLGNGMTGGSSATPVTVETADGNPLLGATAVSTSRYSSCALLSSGAVTCWGIGNELGDGTGTSRDHAGTPTLVQGI